jgi:hypothetical protein
VSAATAWQQAAAARLSAAIEALLGRTPLAPAPEVNAFDLLAERFALDTFERDVLTLCAGYEVDGRVGAWVAETIGGHGRPTAAFALARLEGASWRAFTPSGALRRWRLIHVQDGPGFGQSPLALEENVLHFLLGCPELDLRLRPYLRVAPPAEARGAEEQALAATLLQAWQDDATALPSLAGEREAGLRVVAAAAAQGGATLCVTELAAWPDDAFARRDLVERWQRDAQLLEAALAVDLRGLLPGTPGVAAWLEAMVGPVATLGGEPPADLARPLLRLDLPQPGRLDSRRLWREALGPAGQRLNGELHVLADQFPLSPTAIRATAEAALAAEAGGEPLERALWRLGRGRARGGLDELARRLEPAGSWDRLVLPAPAKEQLRQMVVHLRQRSKVYDDWGFAAAGQRGLGLGALFAGPSGAGKTLAAEVIAGELGLDLYAIDLATTTSKFIGETEKNLRRIFDAAERSGAILLFDEADALFGKRSEVRDSHDRYANLEVSYLLQRIETYRGLAILTTNFDQAIDAAFVRRLRFVVNFPFPGVAERLEIWRQVFPPELPTVGLDLERLAQLQVTGAVIRNIALGGAFLAAEQARPLTMPDLAAAARRELAKHGQAISEPMVRAWT